MNATMTTLQITIGLTALIANAGRPATAYGRAIAVMMAAIADITTAAARAIPAGRDSGSSSDSGSDGGGGEDGGGGGD
jgi:hypothetical protein